MKSINNSALLQVWEQGLEQSPVERALRLLAKVYSNFNLNDLAQLSIGDRDARLLQVRERIFGTQLIAVNDCPNCSERIEWEMETTELLIQQPSTASDHPVFEYEIEGFKLKFRLPNSKDIVKALQNGGHTPNPQGILMDCIIDLQKNGDNYPIDQVPESVLIAVEQEMDKKDPQAHICMLLHCPTCQQAWEAPFDILSYLWVEIDGWARHTLQEVYMLAGAFHWSEQDILQMGPYRRQLYLEMLRS